MRVAVTVSGQVRMIPPLHSIKKYLIDPLKADVYLATWDEPLSYEAIGILRPNVTKLFKPELFSTLKQSFWNRYKKKADPSFLEGRKKFLNGEYGSKKYPVVHRDSMLRMFFLMDEVSSLIPLGHGTTYDVVVQIRPDLMLANNIDISHCEPKTIYAPEIDCQEVGCSDKLLWGDIETMYDVLRCIWFGLPKFAAEISDKKHPPTSNVWMHPEETLGLTITEVAGCRIQPMPVEFYISRPKGYAARYISTVVPLKENDDDA